MYPSVNPNSYQPNNYQPTNSADYYNNNNNNDNINNNNNNNNTGVSQSKASSGPTISQIMRDFDVKWMISLQRSNYYQNNKIIHKINVVS